MFLLLSVTFSHYVHLRGLQLFLVWEEIFRVLEIHARSVYTSPSSRPREIAAASGGPRAAPSREKPPQARAEGPPQLRRGPLRTQDTLPGRCSFSSARGPLPGPSGLASGICTLLLASDLPRVITPCCSCYNCPFSQGCLKMERNLIPPGTETSPLSLC